MPDRESTRRLILELIARSSPVTLDELDRLVRGAAAAPFSPREVRVPRVDRGMAYAGYELGPRANSLVYHVVKRVVIDEQWTVGTTPSEYLDDLRMAIRAPGTRIAVYSYQGGHFAAFLAATADVVQSQRLGRRALDHLLVIYGAEAGVIVTGYQISAIEATSIPVDARWLR